MAKKGFPTLWVIVFLFAFVWFSKDMGWLGSGFDFPWLPAIVLILAFGGIVNHYSKR